ncbi:GNAT superfamily N-acetyltransferase [Psychromicrobium silvestre]|uniref:GNAT superfamily N-acetyltransferase n=1 Tax=Psychromicrobium silvestre TaxID=1645614 RepID=A0A7Y9S7S5_9MICC|nr:GNAT family N-acetyltransferase [Psychromicrobium silvestre]NYE95301.1 GNAT superfamily N-acetyltransferase [Psychromicrobium silvestre]
MTSELNPDPFQADPFRVVPLQLPDSLEAPEAADFLAANQVLDAIRLAIWHNRDRISDLQTRLVSWRPNEYRRLEVFLGKLDGQVIGLSWVNLTLQDNLRTAYVNASVLPELRGRGYAQELLAVAEQYASDQGRKTLLASTEHRADFDPLGPGVLSPVSGTGTIPENDPFVRFALKSGYQLEQVERFSALQLPVPAEKLEALIASSGAKAGEDYRLELWQDRCPDELVASFAVANSRMSTDVPSAGLDIEAEVWDAQRVREMENRYLEARHRIAVCAVVHVPSGEIAAYTYFDFNPEKPELVTQEDTLVVGNHRGKRLGMLVKAANIQSIQKELPQLQRAITWNAAENDHMLSINIELGFVPAGYDGEWQKRLAP